MLGLFKEDGSTHLQESGDHRDQASGALQLFCSIVGELKLFCLTGVAQSKQRALANMPQDARGLLGLKEMPLGNLSLCSNTHSISLLRRCTAV